MSERRERFPPKAETQKGVRKLDMLVQKISPVLGLMKLELLKLRAASVLGVISAIVVGLLGGWDVPIETLLYFMVADYITGILLAGVFKKSMKSDTGTLSSSAGMIGFVKKLVILMMIGISVRLDMVLGTDFIRTASILGFCANELLSITENVGLMLGYNVPDVIKNAVDMLLKYNNGRK